MASMSQANIRRVPFYAADIGSIAANTLHTTESQALPCEGLDHVSVEVKFTGRVGSAGYVVFHVALSTDGETFSTEAYGVKAALDGDKEVRSLPNWIDLRQGVRAIKVLGVTNLDPAVAVDGLNAYLSSTQ